MRPRDAATLIIIRDDREVLLGVRSARHVFMPHMYVFPGGRVDVGDGRVAQPIRLRPAVSEKLERDVSAHRAGAIAMAAVRETFEETGLILGAASETPAASRSPAWQPFFATGLVPALDKLDYVARAITPPNNVRRYDAHFFLCDARHLSGELKGNGELEDLHWVNIAQANRLHLSPVTRMMLEVLAERLASTSGEEVGEEVVFYR